VRAAPAEHHATDAHAAPLTGRTTTLIDGESLLHAPVTIWSGVIVNRRAASGNRFAQHTNDGGMKPLPLCWT
jgi:hypothetical protein